MKGKLSRREEQILKLLLAEYTQSEISSILGFS
ncbi:MAG: DNA-binding CsgD family transcriptional regulator [Salibacteraceae bacterium]|jgi:DNA-binding CsgD family transcriptional regulator